MGSVWPLELETAQFETTRLFVCFSNFPQILQHIRELIAAGARALCWRARVEGRTSLSPADIVHLLSWYQVLRESGSLKPSPVGRVLRTVKPAFEGLHRVPYPLTGKHIKAANPDSGSCLVLLLLLRFHRDLGSHMREDPRSLLRPFLSHQVLESVTGPSPNHKVMLASSCTAHVPSTLSPGTELLCGMQRKPYFGQCPVDPLALWPFPSAFLPHGALFLGPRKPDPKVLVLFPCCNVNTGSLVFFEPQDS